jgi:gas vesicle protein
MADDESEVDAMTRRADDSGRGIGGFAAGVVFGALLGAGIALMFAPDRGDVTRRHLRRRLQRLREDAADGLERAGDRARRDLARGRRHLEDGIERAADKARDAL